jgi:hypothetical protein
MPFDFIKTSFQKDHHESNKSLIEFIKNTIRDKGIKVFYTGWQVKLLNYLIQSVFFVNLYYKLEKENESRKS